MAPTTKATASDREILVSKKEKVFLFLKLNFRSNFSTGLRARKNQFEQFQSMRHRFLFFLKEKAIEEARQSLISLAVATGRAMLKAFGEYPAGKPDLVAALKIYFGRNIATQVQACIDSDIPSEQLMTLQHALAILWEQFELHGAYLTRLHQALSESAESFEKLCNQIFSVICKDPTDTDKRGLSETQLKRFADERLRVNCKSLKGKLTPGQLTRVKQEGDLLVLVNQEREVPLLRRASLSQAVLETASGLDLRILDIRQLWGIFCSHVLADNHCSYIQTVENIAGSPPSYEADLEPLTEQQLATIREIAESPPLGEVCSSLFED